MSIVTREQISKLKGKLHDARQKVVEYEDAIDSLRKICTHRMNYEGHGHNYSVYKCDICGHEEER